MAPRSYTDHLAGEALVQEGITEVIGPLTCETFGTCRSYQILSCGASCGGFQVANSFVRRIVSLQSFDVFVLSM